MKTSASLVVCLLLTNGIPIFAAQPTSIDITTRGAVGDGNALNTKAIQAAIDECSKNGGGTIVVPKGEFITGSILLKSGVSLEVQEGGVLKGSPHVEDYPIMNWRIEGHTEPRPMALVNALNDDHLHITGPGTIDGNGLPFWQSFRPPSRVVVSGKSDNYNTPELCFIQDCSGVLITGVHLKDAGFWNLHLYRCKDVTLENSKIDVSHVMTAPSSDGTDVDSCQNVTIKGCTYSVDDDCVCLKGTRGADAVNDTQSPPTEHVIVSGCTFEQGLGGVVLGTEATIIRDVEIQNCTFKGKMPMLRVKFRPDTPGQHYDNIRLHDCTADGTGPFVFIEPNHGVKGVKPQPGQSSVDNITITNVTGSCGSPGKLKGGPGVKVSNITYQNVNLKAKSGKIESEGVEGLKLENVIINGTPVPGSAGPSGPISPAESSVSEETTGSEPTAPDATNRATAPPTTDATNSSAVQTPAAPPETYSQFNNGTVKEHVPWRDTSGNLINAHDGGIIYADGKYHWYGMALRPNRADGRPDGGQKTTVGVVMYSSSDLYNWTYEGVVLACSTDPKSPLYGPMRFERPKIIYNDTTKQYVMWFHYVGYPGEHGTKLGSGDAGVAVSGKVSGSYDFKGFSRPIDTNGAVRDCTLFKDDDGAAYFIYDRDVGQPGPDGRVLHIVKLTDDYLGFSPTFYEIINASRREAPAMLKLNGVYFLITSAETSWRNNPANYYHSTNIMGPYTEEANPCVGPNPETTFNSQGSYAFPIQGKKNAFILMLERHITACMTDSSFIFLPIQFPSPSALKLAYLPTWDLSHWPQ